jgi:pyrimidine deaminase RibD-like protein
MDKFVRFLGQAFAIATILGVGWALIELSLAARRFLTQSKPEVAATLVTAAITLLGSVLVARLGKHFEVQAEVLREQRAKKAPVYEKLMTFFVDLLTAEKQGRKPPGSQEMVRAIADFMKAAVIWGSDDVIRALNSFRAVSTAHAVEGQPPPNPMFAFEDLLIAIRKDLGHNVRRLRRGELLFAFFGRFDATGEKASER